MLMLVMDMEHGLSTRRRQQLIDFEGTVLRDQRLAGVAIAAVIS